MSDLRIQNLFPIEPHQVSTRIVFAKDSTGGTVWHLVDVSLGEVTADGIYYTALHGKAMKAVTRCDTVKEAEQFTKLGDQFCMRCLDEYELAKDIILERRMLRFK